MAGGGGGCVRRADRGGRGPVGAGRDRLHERDHRAAEGGRAQPARPARAGSRAGGVAGLRRVAAQGRLLPVHDPQHGRAHHTARVAGRRVLDRDGPDRRRGGGGVDPRRAGDHLERPARRCCTAWPRWTRSGPTTWPRSGRCGRAGPTAPRRSAPPSRPSSVSRCSPPTASPRRPRWWRSTRSAARTWAAPADGRSRTSRSASRVTTGPTWRRGRPARCAWPPPTTGTDSCSGTGSGPRRRRRSLAGGELHTGDLGFLDDAGYLHLRDRKSLVIIRGGANVYPAEVERVLAGAAGDRRQRGARRARRAPRRAGGGRAGAGRRCVGRPRCRAGALPGQPGQVQGPGALRGGGSPAPGTRWARSSAPSCPGWCSPDSSSGWAPSATRRWWDRSPC